MPEFKGLDELQSALKKLALEAKRANVSVQVGYSQSYALIVHEDLEAYHPVGQAKYLEAASRRHSSKISDVISKTYKKTKNMKQSLLIGGLFLQRKSQELVPVDTSALKASAFTALSSEAATAAKKSFDRSEIIRKNSKKLS